MLSSRFTVRRKKPLEGHVSSKHQLTSFMVTFSVSVPSLLMDVLNKFLIVSTCNIWLLLPEDIACGKWHTYHRLSSTWNLYLGWQLQWSPHSFSIIIHFLNSYVWWSSLLFDLPHLLNSASWYPFVYNLSSSLP